MFPFSHSARSLSALALCLLLSGCNSAGWQQTTEVMKTIASPFRWVGRSVLKTTLTGKEVSREAAAKYNRLNPEAAEEGEAPDKPEAPRGGLIPQPKSYDYGGGYYAP